MLRTANRFDRNRAIRSAGSSQAGKAAPASNDLGALWAGDTTDRQERTHSYGLGQPSTAQEIEAWNIDVAPTGEGLPPGRGTVKEGAAVFAARCASCHGSTGRKAR